jgi:lipid-binding SYLF domain-containing protein
MKVVPARPEGEYALRPTMRVVGVLTIVATLLASCATAPSTPGGREVLQQQATAAMTEMSKDDPGLDELTRKGYAYALFPEIAKGGLVFGGGYGRGVVYEQGQHIGYVDLSQASFGLQVGGQTYSELIVFENKAALERLKQGRIDLAAGASAVILKTGAAVNAHFVDGIAVIVRPIGGAMAEATVGGQQVTYVPK